MSRYIYNIYTISIISTGACVTATPTSARPLPTTRCCSASASTGLRYNHWDSQDAQKCRYVDLTIYIVHQGINCEECQDGFTQKKWRRYTADDQFECEPCNCHGHTKKCSYNETVS